MPKPAITRVSSMVIDSNYNDLNSKNNGFYAPQLTQAQIDQIPASTLKNGAIVYNATSTVYQIYQSGQWGILATGIGAGANSTVGSATLIAGTITVNTGYVTANSNIFLQTQGTIGVANAGNVRVSAIVIGTSFDITSTDNADTSTVRWFIVNS